MILRALCFLLLCTLVRADFRRPDGTEEVTFELNGARCAVVLPPAATRTNRVLIYCHGYRPENATLDPELTLRQTYLEYLTGGWIIASTSYRRSGLVVADGMKDVLALRDEIAKRYGEPWVVVLHGESMGGAIATLLCESEPKKFAGAVVVGAALGIEESGKKLPLTGQPQVPIVFLNNRSELDPAATYTKQAKGVVPITRTVNRDGHVNINQAELGAALKVLNYWISTKKRPEAQPVDLTLPPYPRASTMKALGAGTGEAYMLLRHPIYGNVTLDVQPLDLQQIGLQKGDVFRLSHGDKAVEVKLGTTYSDVPKGQWVAFFDGEERLLVALNGGNAADTLGLKVGDKAVLAVTK
ncbi:MAG: SAM-dependent chlorinase/fluorinase [Verrucomicrobia bacterium]|nr:SAM-dependent chlorinase/fluorinase [Verrucomicrobiota bacterium]